MRPRRAPSPGRRRLLLWTRRLVQGPKPMSGEVCSFNTAVLSDLIHRLQHSPGLLLKMQLPGFPAYPSSYTGELLPEGYKATGSELTEGRGVRRLVQTAAWTFPASEGFQRGVRQTGGLGGRAQQPPTLCAARCVPACGPVWTVCRKRWDTGHRSCPPKTSQRGP